MRIRLAVPDELDDQDRKAALDAALESVTRTVTGLVRSGKAPPAAGEIKAKRVRWEPEPPGDEHFDLPGTILQRGHGDCDDLAPWHAGSLRAAGIDPKARAFVKKSGPRRWHALVRRGDGSIEDPSLAAGMHSVSGPAVMGSAGAIGTPMSADGRMCLAICPSRDPRHPSIWFARCDVPDSLEPWDWTSTAASHHPAKSLLHAVKAVRRVAGADIDDDDAARLGAMNDLILGAEPEQVAEALAEIMGEDFDLEGCMEDVTRSVGFLGEVVGGSEVGSFWKKLGKITKSVAPFVSKAVQFIPGVGPVASSAIDVSTKFIPSGGGGGGGGGGFATLIQRAKQQQAALQQAALQAAQQRPVVPVAAPQMPTALTPELAQLLTQFLAQQSAPRFQYEAGKVGRPWGINGPSVMRF